MLKTCLNFLYSPALIFLIVYSNSVVTNSPAITEFDWTTIQIQEISIISSLHRWCIRVKLENAFYKNTLGFIRTSCTLHGHQYNIMGYTGLHQHMKSYCTIIKVSFWGGKIHFCWIIEVIFNRKTTKKMKIGTI